MKSVTDFIVGIGLVVWAVASFAGMPDHANRLATALIVVMVLNLYQRK